MPLFSTFLTLCEAFGKQEMTVFLIEKIISLIILILLLELCLMNNVTLLINLIRIRFNIKLILRRHVINYLSRDTLSSLIFLLQGLKFFLMQLSNVKKSQACLKELRLLVLDFFSVFSGPSWSKCADSSLHCDHQLASSSGSTCPPFCCTDRALSPDCSTHFSHR